jgi:hypothetical protein
MSARMTLLAIKSKPPAQAAISHVHTLEGEHPLTFCQKPLTALGTCHSFSSRLSCRNIGLPHKGHQMPETQSCIAVCCYKTRAVESKPCDRCKLHYGCLSFRSATELAQFNRLIPPSMIGSPLPLNVWPNLWKVIAPDTDATTGESPVQLLAAALGLPYDGASMFERPATDLI